MGGLGGADTGPGLELSAFRGRAACRHEPRSGGLVSFRPVLLGPVHKPLLTSFLSPFQRAFVPLAFTRIEPHPCLLCAILGEIGATMSHFSPLEGSVFARPSFREQNPQLC